MQLYQNYPMNNYSQYPNMYQQPQMPVQYMDRLSQLQASQQSQMIPPTNHRMLPGLSGGIVDDFNIITANDVPMDGNGAIFIKRDGSEIQVRNWNANGSITASVFRPVTSEAENVNSGNGADSHAQLVDSLSLVFQKQFDDLNGRFDKLEKALKAKGGSKDE